MTIGATRVVSSPGALAAAVLALAGAEGMSSSSEMLETLSKLKVSSLTGAGCTGAGWALDWEQGAMFGMCIEDIPKSLLICNLSYWTVKLSRLIRSMNTQAAIHHFSTTRILEIDKIEYRRKNFLNWIEVWSIECWMSLWVKRLNLEENMSWNGIRSIAQRATKLGRNGKYLFRLMR
jgi:hypothetical protein